MVKTATKNRISSNGKSTNGRLKKNEVEKRTKEFLGFLRRVSTNQDFSRAALAEMITGGGHQLDDACGYPRHIEFADYKFLIDREGIATRANSIYPDECFSSLAHVYETEAVDEDAQTPFEKSWLSLLKAKPVWNKLNRLDVVSGYGYYGIMVIGTNDPGTLDQPFPGIDKNGDTIGEPKPHELLYLMPYNQGEARINGLEQDKNCKRYGKPLFYNVITVNPSVPGTNIGITQNVHWTRVIHVADGCTSSDVLGKPRLEKVFNYIMNIRKIMGGSAEMFYMGGFPGTTFTVPPELVNAGELDQEGLTRQIEEYFAGFRRYLALSGVEAKQLQPNIADPDTHIHVQLTGLCIALEVPMKIFTGTEEARMASMNDSESWNRRIHRRQDIHVTPNILRPTVDRFIQMGILPKPQKVEYQVKWPDVYAVSEADRADITGKLVRALGEYCTTGSFKIFPPLQFFTMMMDLSADQAEEILSAAVDAIKAGTYDYLDELIAKPGTPPGDNPNQGNGGRRSPLGTTRKAKFGQPSVNVGGVDLTINPAMKCQRNGMPGFKYGPGGNCYTYSKDDKDSKKKALKRAKLQGVAIEISRHLINNEEEQKQIDVE